MQEAISDFYDAQFAAMPQMKESYDRLSQVKRRRISMGDADVFVQCNPARARSTTAAVSREEVAKRPCFLCRKNRPERQLAGEAIQDYEILINPYPILPVHFTIASREHRPQDGAPLEMVDMLNMMPSLCTFYNGASAGASAPDHLHFQAVLRSELPLLHAVEERHAPGDAAARTSDSLGDFPMRFVSLVIKPDFTGMQLLAVLPRMGGISDNKATQRGLVNVLMWKDDSGLLRALLFPRRRHRPDCYFAEGEQKMLVSPGALDMAGIIVTPREEDYERITADDIRRIYAQVGISAADMEQYRRQADIAPFFK